MGLFFFFFFFKKEMKDWNVHNDSRNVVIEKVRLSNGFKCAHTVIVK